MKVGEVVFFSENCALILCIFTERKNKKESCDSLKSEDVKVNWEDFKSALQKFVPSINAKDMEYFNKLKASFSSGSG